MRKSARTQEEGKRQPSRWIRGGISTVPPDRSSRNAAAAPAPSPSGTAHSKKRFIEPFRYDEGQREAIGTALAAEGLADETSREIFVGAIAYDLAVLREAAADVAGAEQATAAQPREPSRVKPDDRPAAQTPAAIPEALARSAREVAASLGALTDEQRRALCVALSESDPLGREYGGTFLGAIGRELEHIAGTAERLASAREATASENSREGRRRPLRKPAIAEPSPVALAFIAHAGNVYLQCFDASPSADPQGSFARVLSAIAKTTGIAIPVDSSALERALQRGPDGAPRAG
ncbi:MAG: hypothetical protein PVH47_08240 [Thiohalocapsa sp.]|jgi:hypothetical protein